MHPYVKPSPGSAPTVACPRSRRAASSSMAHPIDNAIKGTRTPGDVTSQVVSLSGLSTAPFTSVFQSGIKSIDFGDVGTPQPPAKQINFDGAAPVPVTATRTSIDTADSGRTESSFSDTGDDNYDDDDLEVLTELQREELSHGLSQSFLDPDFLEHFDMVCQRPTVDKKAHSTPTKRQKLENNQSTLSQFYSHAAPSSSFDQPRTRDPNIWEYLGVQYGKGDTWKMQIANSNTYFVCIANKHPKKLGQAVVRQVHTSIEDTFVGIDQGRRLVEHRQARSVKHPELIKYGSTLKLLDQGSLSVNKLSTRTMTESVNGMILTDLIFEELPSKKSTSVGFTCAYRFHSDEYKLIHLPVHSKGKIRTLECFAGSRGSGLGFDLEQGFNTTHVVDIDRCACDTIRRNSLNNMIVWNEDIRAWLKNCEAPRRLNSYPQPGDFEHISWSPPCQGMSSANRNGGMNDNDNNDLTVFGVEIIRHFMPYTFFMEQVHGIMLESKGRRKFIQRTMVELIMLDYQVRLSIVRASDYGDAQDRDRVVLFGAKKGHKLPDFPKATHGETEELAKRKTAKDILRVLEGVPPCPVSGRVELPDGRIVEDHCLDASPNEHPSNTCRLVPDKPAPTVRRKNAMKHYNHDLDRLVTIREAALLQGYPIDYAFCGNHQSVRDQIGNSVPVNLAMALAREIRKSYK